MADVGADAVVLPSLDTGLVRDLFQSSVDAESMYGADSSSLDGSGELVTKVLHQQVGPDPK